MGYYYDTKKRKYVVRHRIDDQYIYIGAYHRLDVAHEADDRYRLTGEKLPVDSPPTRAPTSLPPLEASYVAYSDYASLREQHKNQVKELTAKYSRRTS